MTQARLALRAGVTRETVYRAEAGRLPAADTAARLCDALELDRDVLDLRCAETDAIVSHPPLTLLRDRRRALGLTLERCAAEAGVSTATLSRFERGIERSASLVRFDKAGWPVELVNPGLAAVLGFRTLADFDRYCRIVASAGSPPARVAAHGVVRRVERVCPLAVDPRPAPAADTSPLQVHASPTPSCADPPRLRVDVAPSHRPGSAMATPSRASTSPMPRGGGA